MRTSNLRRFAAVLSLLALFGASGGQWLLLQSVAWAQMWSRLSRTETLAKAAVHTFDGKHPCALCKKIVHARTREKTRQIRLEIQNFPLPRPDCGEDLAWRFPGLIPFRLLGRRDGPSNPVRPPTPPPRLSLA